MISTFIFHVFCDGSCVICWYTLLASSLPPSSSLRVSRPLFSFRRIEMSEYWRGWSSISSLMSLVINLHFNTPRNNAKQTNRSVAAATQLYQSFSLHLSGFSSPFESHSITLLQGTAQALNWKKMSQLLSICTCFLESLVHGIDFLTWFFFSISNLIFTACLACKIQFEIDKKIKFKNQFNELEISKIKCRGKSDSWKKTI